MQVTIDNIDITAKNIARFTFSDGSFTELGVSPPVVPPPAPLPGSTIIRGGYFDLIPNDKARSFADQLGMQYVRIWRTIKDWFEVMDDNDPTFIRCRLLQSLGLKTLVVFTPPEKTGAPPDVGATAYNFFRNAAQAAKGAVNAWEVWNEPNLVNYNTSYPSQATLWIRNGLMPAYTALNSQKQFVVSGGWSEGPNNGLAYAIQSGVLKFCDAFGYHPYGANATEQVSRVQQVRNMIGDKPMWLTEWNLHMNGQKDQWADQLVVAALGIRPLVQAVIHFRMVRTTQPAGYGAPLWNDNGTLLPTPSFHDKLIEAMKVFG